MLNSMVLCSFMLCRSNEETPPRGRGGGLETIAAASSRWSTPRATFPRNRSAASSDTGRRAARTTGDTRFACSPARSPPSQGQRRVHLVLTTHTPPRGRSPASPSSPPSDGRTRRTTGDGTSRAGRGNTPRTRRCLAANTVPSNSADFGTHCLRKRSGPRLPPGTDDRPVRVRRYLRQRRLQATSSRRAERTEDGGRRMRGRRAETAETAETTEIVSSTDCRSEPAQRPARRTPRQRLRRGRARDEAEEGELGRCPVLVVAEDGNTSVDLGRRNRRWRSAADMATVAASPQRGSSHGTCSASAPTATHGGGGGQVFLCNDVHVRSERPHVGGGWRIGEVRRRSPETAAARECRAAPAPPPSEPSTESSPLSTCDVEGHLPAIRARRSAKSGARFFIARLERRSGCASIECLAHRLRTSSSMTPYWESSPGLHGHNVGF